MRVWATRAAAAGAISAGRLRALQGRRRDSLGHACRCGTTVVQSTLSHGSPRACRASPADFVSPGNNSRGVRAFFFFFLNLPGAHQGECQTHLTDGAPKPLAPDAV